MSNEKMVDMANIIIRSCPRCGSKDVKLKTTNRQVASLKRGICKDCGLKIESMDANFIAWMFNRSREEIIEHALRDLERAPFTAYIHEATVDIWDGELSLKHYISREKGWKVNIKPATTVGKGYILDRVN